MNPYLAIIIANVIMGMTAPIMKMGLTEIPPAILGFIRFGTASLLMAPFVLKNWKPIGKKDLLILITCGVFGIGLGILLFLHGLQLTKSIFSPVIASSGPVILYIVALIYLKEKFIIKKFGGMMVAFAGVLVIVLAPLMLNGTEVHHKEAAGNALIFGGTILGVLHAFLLKKISKEVNLSQVVFIVTLSGALTFMLFTFQEMAAWSYSDVTIRGWSALFFGTFFVSILAYTLIHYALMKISAPDVGIFTYIDPIAALVIAWPLLGEKPDIFYAAGSILVFGGIYIAEGRLHWHPFHKLKTIN